jgi:murein DD-endopeptidase MepM/ murein hydrolase activator NlpD
MMTGFVFLAILAGCVQGTPTPDYTPTATNSPPATATYTPSPTTPAPLEGRLFFDMNGSGLPDEASFDIDLERLNSPVNQLVRDYISTNPSTYYQPDKVSVLKAQIEDYISVHPDTLRDEMHPVLLKTLDDYVQAHPGVEDDSLITIDEPALGNYTVCKQNDCVQTDEQGNFSLPNPSGASSASIKVTDPYADFPAWAMRYINNLKGPGFVPAYTKDVDAATMARLTTIPGCDIDLAALVCKLNETTLQVRDQHLSDTSIIPIEKGTVIKLGEDNNVGLMQGFLTLPFVSEQVPKPFIWNYFDILSNLLFDDAGKNTFLSSQDGMMLNYNGMYHQIVPPASQFSELTRFVHLSGVGDSHTGLDYLVPVGNYVVSGAPTSSVWFLLDEHTANLLFPIAGENFETAYGHMTNLVVDLDQVVYRGQIIGISGDDGEGAVPQLHFHLGKRTPEGWYYLDPNRYTVGLDPLPENFWGSEVSWWTNDNNPQFPRIDSENK